MKNLHNSKRFLTVLILLLLTSAYQVANAQESYITETSITVNDLSSAQLANYNNLTKSGELSDFHFIHFRQLTDVQDSGMLYINLSFLQCNQYYFKARNVAYVSENDYKWYGQIYSDADDSCSDGSLTIVHNEAKGGYVGNLSLNNLSYPIYDLGEGLQVMTSKNLSFQAGAVCGNTGAVPLPKPTGGDDCVKKDIKVLVLYTPEARSNISNGTMQLMADLFVFQVNSFYANSEINGHLQLAGAAELSGFIEAPDLNIPNDFMKTDVYKLRNDVTAHNLRAQYHADVVILIVAPFYGNSKGRVTDIIGGGFDDAYGMVDVMWTSTYGTFTHELSHILGARHDNDPDPGNAHGYTFSKTTWFFFKKNYETNGALLWPNKSPIDYISNPDVEYNGKATGNSNHNNAQKIREMLPITGAFYTEPQGFQNNIGVSWVALPQNPPGQPQLPCRYKAIVTAHVNDCGTPPYTHNWEISYDGINYTAFGTGNSLDVFFPGGSGTIFMRLSTQSGSTIAWATRGLFFSCINHQDPIEPMSYQVEIADATEPYFNVHPNPNNGHFELDFGVPENENVEITLMDISGRQLGQLFNGTLERGNSHLYLSLDKPVSKGIYMINIKGRTINVTKKIIIQ